MNKFVFFDEMRKGLLGPTLSDDEVKGCEAILNTFEGCPVSYKAYALATAYHETNATMLPVEESYWLSDNWRKKNLRYYPWHGRGYVQLTWISNYKKADQKLGLAGALMKDPTLAMRPDIAAQIMRRGMIEGWFGGTDRHTLARHLPSNIATLDQFKNARRIINGVDKNILIARIALRFQDALQAAA